MFLDFFKKILPSEIKTYRPPFGEVPQNIDECEAWIISGSPKSVYDSDPWIKELISFVQKCDAKKKKLIGICFGHQLIAHALGGKAEKAKSGWGVGIKTFRMFKNKNWMTPNLQEASLLFSHQDQVTTLPKNAELLATDSFCPNQMYEIGGYILCLQGHPEFTKTFMRDRLIARAEIIEPKTYDVAIKSLESETQSNVIGNWIRNFLTI